MRSLMFMFVALMTGCPDTGEGEEGGEGEGEGVPVGEGEGERIGEGEGERIGEGEGEGELSEGEGEEGGEEGEGEPVGEGEGEGEEGEGEPVGGEGEGEPIVERQVFFSRPTIDNPIDTTLEDVLVSLLALAEPGSRVRVALYEWDRVAMVAPFVEASLRGVDVRIVLDDINADEPAVAELASSLPAGAVTLCPGGACIGTGINHNKVFLFERLSDGSENVVVQSSANLRASQLRQHNNMVVARNDALLFAGYLSYWQDLQAQQSNPDYYRTVDGDEDAHPYPLRAFFFPRADGDGDTIENALELVTCSNGARIRVAMAFFTDARIAIASQLARLQGDGCDVRVVIRNAGDPAPGDAVVALLQTAGIETVLYPTLSGQRRLHSKVLLIDAIYNDSAAPRRIVFTGSHNYTGGALNRNDEVLLRIEDDTLYEGFLQHWTDIRADLP
jgi:hypothetical protein